MCKSKNKKSKKEKLLIEPIGNSSTSVTGSCIRFTYYDKNNEKIEFLSECGGLQESNNLLTNYNLTKKMLQQIKPQNLKYIFVQHGHFDHIGNICSLYHGGRCNATIIVPKGSSGILYEMWNDSVKISERECELINKKYKKQYVPFYNYEDVDNAIAHIKEYQSNEIIKLTDELSFMYTPAGHIALSNQLSLFVRLNNHVKKVLVTSDLGNKINENAKIFVEPFQQVSKANIVIGESTYGLRDRQASKKDFEKDIEKIKSTIQEVCIQNKGRVLIPCFSLDRLPFMMWILYEMFRFEKDFNLQFVIDSPLSIRLLDRYEEFLTGEDLSSFKRMRSWKNFKEISDYNDSASCICDKQAKVVLSSSGMINAGRSVAWTSSILKNNKDCILFCGYSSPNTLSYRIKNGCANKTININGKPIANRCNIVDLHSFSSHMQHNDLVNYYSSIQSEAVYLLHGDEEARLELKEDLQKKLANMSKTTKVKIVTKGMKIYL